MSNQIRPEAVEALSRIDSPTVANAIETFHVRDRTEGYASMALRCQLPELGPMVGYAVTCTVDSTTSGPARPSRRREFFEAVVASPKPVVVVIQAVGPEPTRTCVAGDLAVTTYRTLGAVGLVTDGGIRDLEGIRRQAPGFQVFAAGAVVSHGSLARVDVNTRVTVGGLTVEPGDLLHGDMSGLVSVPLDIAESIVEQARRVLEAEAETFEFLRAAAGRSLDEIDERLGGADLARRPTSD